MRKSYYYGCKENGVENLLSLEKVTHLENLFEEKKNSLQRGKKNPMYAFPFPQISLQPNET